MQHHNDSSARLMRDSLKDCKFGNKGNDGLYQLFPTLTRDLETDTSSRLQLATKTFLRPDELSNYQTLCEFAKNGACDRNMFASSIYEFEDKELRNLVKTSSTNFTDAKFAAFWALLLTQQPVYQKKLTTKRSYSTSLSFEEKKFKLGS